MTSNDTLRVGDRAVPLDEIEARYIAHRDALNAHADGDATQAEHAAYRLGLSAIHDIPALLAEVRRSCAVPLAEHDCTASVLLPIPDILAEYREDYAHSGEGGIDDEGRACFAIDACIAPAVLALWRAGFRTLGCCSGHGSGHGCVTIDLSACADDVSYASRIALQVDNRVKAMESLQAEVARLFEEVRRLRAVEHCICGHDKAAHNDFDEGPCVWKIDDTYSCSCDAFTLAAAPDTEGGTDAE